MASTYVPSDLVTSTRHVPQAAVRGPRRDPRSDPVASDRTATWRLRLKRCPTSNASRSPTTTWPAFPTPRSLRSSAGLQKRRVALRPMGSRHSDARPGSSRRRITAPSPAPPAACCSPPPKPDWFESPTPTRTTIAFCRLCPIGSAHASCTTRPDSTPRPGNSMSTSPAADTRSV